MTQLTISEILDWPPRPISSTAIRILHLGHILEDKFVLSPKELTSGTSMLRAMPVGKSTVVHLLLSQAPSKADGDGESRPVRKMTMSECS